MQKFVLAVAVTALSPFAAQAAPTGFCQLFKSPRIDSPSREKRLEILARDLDVSGNAETRVFQSNDGTLRLRIVKSTAQGGRTQIQFEGFEKDTQILSAATGTNGTITSTQASALLSDGSAVTLSCTVTE